MVYYFPLQTISKKTDESAVSETAGCLCTEDTTIEKPQFPSFFSSSNSRENVIDGSCWSWYQFPKNSKGPTEEQEKKTAGGGKFCSWDKLNNQKTRRKNNTNAR